MFILKGVAGAATGVASGVGRVISGSLGSSVSKNEEPNQSADQSEADMVDDLPDDLRIESTNTLGSLVSVNISHFTVKTKESLTTIFIPRRSTIKKGFKLAENLVVHSFLGGGWQGGVFELADNHGNVRHDVVLKMLKPGAILGDLEKEWAIGAALNVLVEPDGSVPGFMKTFQAIRNQEDGVFRGMLLERLNGKDLSKIITQPDFHDIHYIRDMLFQIFTALDRAYTVLGFHHTDCRLPNVMEHHPDPDHPERREFKVIDFGLAYLEDRDTTLLKKLRKTVFRTVRAPGVMAKVLVKEANPFQQLSHMVEAGYRAFWWKKEDVYHFLQSMSGVVDGRVWPMKDKKAVEDFADLMEYVTGISLTTYFAEETEDGLEEPAKLGIMDKLFRYKGLAKFNGVRQARIRLQSLIPIETHSAISPAKALRFPFFLPIHFKESESAGHSKRVSLAGGLERKTGGLDAAALDDRAVSAALETAMDHA